MNLGTSEKIKRKLIEYHKLVKKMDALVLKRYKNLRKERVARRQSAIMWSMASKQKAANISHGYEASVCSARSFSNTADEFSSKVIECNFKLAMASMQLSHVADTYYDLKYHKKGGKGGWYPKLGTKTPEYFLDCSLVRKCGECKKEVLLKGGELEVHCECEQIYYRFTAGWKRRKTKC